MTPEQEQALQEHIQAMPAAGYAYAKILYEDTAPEKLITLSFQDNQVVIDWVNKQTLASTLTCIGDGHDGIWNIVDQLAPNAEGREVLDWFHLTENLHKVGGSLKRLKQAPAFLWKAQLEETKALFTHCKGKQSQNFCRYLDKHRDAYGGLRLRIINTEK